MWNAPSAIVPDTVDLPIYAVTPEKIFANEVPFLDVNIINPNSSNSAASSLQPIVSSWYIALRNFAIIAMLSILVYVGIRIILSSTVTDKVKYKQLLIDWLIAICLLFFMHYIMSFAITIVEEVTKSLKASIYVPVIELDLSNYNIPSGSEKELTIQQVDAAGGGSYDTEHIKWATDFTGLARFRAQLDYDNDTSSADYVAEGGKARLAYTIIYVVLVIYTVMFVFQYLKRLIYIIFLTMIAPLVAMTYPIDKINDGSAQAFNMWLKEYIFNLLIQPFHLLIYSMLIGSAIELATNHLIYALAVLGFMLPAEKILRKFFGFEKAGVGSSFLGGAVGGAMVMQAIGKISSKALSGGKKGSSGDSKGGNTDGDKVRMSDRSPDNPEEEDNFLMDALGGSTDDGNVSQDNINAKNSLEQDEINKRLQEEGFEDGYSVRKARELGIEGDNKLEQYEQARKQREEDIRNQLRMQKEQEVSKKDTKPTTNTNAITGPSKKKLKFSMKAAAPIVGKGALKLGKGIAKAYGAATLGTIGVAAGLASEDYANVAKFGAAGVTAGAAITGVAINKGKDLPSNIYRKATNIKDEYVKNYYKDDPAAYKEYMNEQADNAFMRDKNVQKLYKDKFGTREVDDGHGKQVAKYKLAMEKAMTYRQHGITDNDVIIKAMKANVKGVGDWDSKQRIAAAKYANQVSNEKDIQTMSDRLKKRGVAQDKLAAQEDMLRQIKGLN